MTSLIIYCPCYNDNLVYYFSILNNIITERQRQCLILAHSIGLNHDYPDK